MCVQNPKSKVVGSDSQFAQFWMAGRQKIGRRNGHALCPNPKSKFFHEKIDQISKSFANHSNEGIKVSPRVPEGLILFSPINLDLDTKNLDTAPCPNFVHF